MAAEALMQLIHKETVILNPFPVTFVTRETTRRISLPAGEGVLPA
jgi:LacI family transcriptional regulator